MNISIDRRYSPGITIQNASFLGAFLDVTLTAQEALQLLRALEAKHGEIFDLATNYYECDTCAELHHKAVRICPAVSEDEEW